MPVVQARANFSPLKVKGTAWETLDLPDSSLQKQGYGTSALWHNILHHTGFFTIMNTQKKGTFWFCFPGLLGIHRNPKWKDFFKSREFFFEKSLCLYFDWQKFWIWGTLEQVMDIFCIWHFHNASKKSFGQKNFLNFMHGFKSGLKGISKILFI